MADIRRTGKLEAIPPDHASLLRELVAQVGIREACRRSGLGRAAMLSVLVAGEALPGTCAILREYVARRSEAA